MSRVLRFLPTALAAASLAACGSTSGLVDDLRKIEVDPSSRDISVDPGTIAVGDTKTLPFTVINTGKTQLCISAVTLATGPKTAAEAADPDGPAFRLATPGPAKGSPVCIAPAGQGTPALPDSYRINVIFKRYDDAEAREATLTIVNDDNLDVTLQNYTIQLRSTVCNSTLDVPESIDFGNPTKDNPSIEKPLDLTNGGSCKIAIDGFRIDGDKNFTLTIDGTPYTSEQNPGEVKFDPTLVVDALSSAQWKVRFDAKTGDPATATLTVHTSEPSAPGGHAVKLVVNGSGPKLTVVPSPIEFGGKVIGQPGRIDVTLNSVGTEPVEVTALAFKAPASGFFKLLPDKLSTGKLPITDNPATKLTIGPSGSETFTVEYTPTAQNPVDPKSGQVLLDADTLVVANNTFYGALEVQTSGFGLPKECPLPVITTEEGEEVLPQTVLHLHGDQSLPAAGAIQSWNWSVQQPPENNFSLVPSASFKNPTHEENVAGEYTYCLDVCDAQYCSNDPQCHTTACKVVVVVPSQAIHVELTWDTPADLNKTDTGSDAGADMDLHFAHPYASGPDIDGDLKPDPWFDTTYDCFWFNPKPQWESLSADGSYDPRLDRDDTDGWGPENINLDQPVSGRVYHVGVHYWNDHGMGLSYPWVKVYIWGKLAWQRNLKDDGIKVLRCDLWDVGTIDWPSGTFTPRVQADGSPKITHHYLNPAFVQISGGSCD